MMRILMVNKFLYPKGGAETYMFKLGEYLQSLGHQVEYFGMEHPERCVANSLDLYTEGMDFHNSSAIKKLKLSLKTIYSKEARKKMKHVLDGFNPDVVHLNNFNYQLTPSIIYAIKDYEKENGCKVKVVFTAHDYQLVCPNHMMNNPISHNNCDKCLNGNYLSCAKDKCIHASLLKSVIGSAEGYLYKNLHTYSFIDKVICCSDFMETKIQCNPSLKGKTVVLHNFIDKQCSSKTHKKDYVLYFGRYSEEKGIRALCQSVKMLPEIQFVFAGKGELEDLINSIPNIKNVGFITGKKLDELIEDALFSVYPSEWYENCPFSVMESISLMTPVIASNIGGIPELISNQENGLLFESKNTDDLREKISYLYNNKELCAQMSLNCKNNSFDSLEQYTEKYLQIIGSIQ